MTQLQTMYPGVANSPETFLKEALTIDGTIMYLADGSVLGEIPTLAVIGEGQQAETVLVVSTRSDGGFAINRGVEGYQKAWTKATTVARNWTNKDYETIRANIEAVNDGKVDKADVVTSVNGKKGDTLVDFFVGDDTRDLNYAPKDYLEHGVRFKANTNSQFEFKRCTAVGVSRLIAQTYCILNTQVPWANASGGLPMQVAYGKGVIATRGAIDDNGWGEWKKVTTTNDLTELAKRTDIKTRLADMTSDSTHRTVTDDEKKAWSKKVDIVNDLTTGGADKALSAEQGKTLEDTKLNKTDVVNNLTTGGVDKALSAEQGKVLFTYADDGKKSIADAIVGKGVDATKSDDFNTLADKISKIKTGYGVGEEVSGENVQEVKTFHKYENESDFVLDAAKIEFTKDGKAVEIGEPSALVVNSFEHPYVGTNKGKLFSFDAGLANNYVASDSLPITAMSALPNGDLVTAYSGHTKIYRNNIGVSTQMDKMRLYWWSCDVGPGQVNVMTSYYYHVYCGVGNKVIEVTDGMEKSWEFTGHTAQVNAIAVDKDWNVYSGGADNKVFKISHEGKKVWEFTLHTAAVNALAVDDDGYVYSGGADCTICKISPDGKKVWEDKTNNEITAIAVEPNGSVMLGTTGSTLYTFFPDTAPKKAVELGYADENGKTVQDGNIVDIVVANDASIFMITKKEKLIHKIKFGEYKTSYKIIK